MFTIKKLDRSYQEPIINKINQKTKPKGALGMLEELALQLVLVLGKIPQIELQDRISLADPIQIKKPVMLIFAGDHGIAEENISIAPSAVTQQMVVNFLEGGAAINCFCHCNDIEMEVIDAGILLPVDNKNLTQHSLGNGTKKFVNDTAMSSQHVEQGLQLGKKVVQKHLQKGCNVFGFGEMGIGNTSAAAAIFSALTHVPVAECVGRGTGVDDKTLAKKTQLLHQAIEFHQHRLGDKYSEPMEVMASFGGFEIVQMVGAMLATAESHKIILVDGFIATAAAMLATKLYPDSRDYMIFCHQSEEQGHQLMLKHLQAEPLLNLGLRLGEGTGAALAVPLIRASARFYNDMASFDSAGVTTV